MLNKKTRVNQDFAKNSSLIGKVEKEKGFIPFEDDNEIVKNLIYYISELHQIGTDNQGYIRFELKEFCKEYGYKPNVYQKGTKEKGKIRIIDTDDFHLVSNIFEKTLTSIASQNIPVPIVNARGNYAIEFVPVIQELEIGLTGSGYKDKRAYFIKIHDDYKRKFINYFNTTSSELYKLLKKKHKRTKGLQDLYLKLEVEKSKLIHEKGYKKRLFFHPYFDDLCNIAQISNSYEDRQKKRYLKQKLDIIKAEAELYNQELKEKGLPASDFIFELDFIHKKNHRFNYQPKITFLFEKDVIKQKKIEQEQSSILFEQQFKNRLSKEFNTLGLSISLNEWLKNDKLSSDLKRNIYVKEYELTYHKEPSLKYLRGRFG